MARETSKPTILVVDDETNIRFVLTEVLRRENYQPVEASDGQEALEIVQNGGIDLVIMDIRMPRLDGMTAMKKMLGHNPSLLVVLITAHGTNKTGLEAVENGAYDYLTKPFDLTEVRVVIRRALEKAKLRSDMQVMEAQQRSRYAFGNVIGQSKAMGEVFDLIERVVDTDVTVLITGESGTGKEMIASVIHHNSPRKQLPFIKVNTVAIPETLLESELFGHEKGSFTGATDQKIGKFEAANKGSIFLDEIGDMPLTLQAKLLRVLQEREIERVGSTKTQDVDIRVICATNRNLGQCVQDKSFREDLYYRINVVPIYLPPLRERPQDVALLIDHFIERYAPRFARPIEAIDAEALELCLNYRWPGNVRELENLMQRTILMAKGSSITVEDLPPIIKGQQSRDGTEAGYTPPPIDDMGLGNPLKELDLSRLLDTEDFSIALSDRLSEISDELEKFLIKAALLKANHHRQETADLLGISRKSLHNKMVRHDLMSGITTSFDA